jgi:hypothetical protein
MESATLALTHHPLGGSEISAFHLIVQRAGSHCSKFGRKLHGLCGAKIQAQVEADRPATGKRLLSELKVFEGLEICVLSVVDTVPKGTHVR